MKKTKKDLYSTLELTFFDKRDTELNDVKKKSELVKGAKENDEYILISTRQETFRNKTKTIEVWANKKEYKEVNHD